MYAYTGEYFLQRNTLDSQKICSLYRGCRGRTLEDNAVYERFTFTVNQSENKHNTESLNFPLSNKLFEKAYLQLNLICNNYMKVA